MALLCSQRQGPRCLCLYLKRCAARAPGRTAWRLLLTLLAARWTWTLDGRCAAARDGSLMLSAERLPRFPSTATIPYCVWEIAKCGKMHPENLT